MRALTTTSSTLTRILTAALAALMLLGLLSADARAQVGDIEIFTVGNRADLISAGNALVRIELPADADAESLAVRVGEADVTSAFAARPNGQIMGVVEGLALGPNVLEAIVADGRGARLTITNHPVGGPVFSGPQVQPWVCNTADTELGKPLDAQCNAATVVDYLYMPEGGGGLAPYDPADPAEDVAEVTTDQDKTVPFIVRHELGTANRGIYAIAVLEDPANPMAPWNPDEHAWNHKVHWPYGAGCGIQHNQAQPSAVLNADRLASGYLVANSSLNILGENCSTVTSAEATMMLQEHIVEQFGEIRFVIGSGCSGGSIGQNMIANNYPGLLDGIQPNCTYVDNYSTGMEVLDCHLLIRYFTEVSPQLWANPVQQAAVADQAGPGPCAAWDATFAAVNDPSSQGGTTGCNLDAEVIYDPENNPGGVRCTLPDFAINIWGERPESQWTDVEQALGRGFANSAYDNTGVQWGLNALQDGVITTEQFVDINEKLGSVDIDFNPQTERTSALPEVADILYRTGSINDGRQMDQVAIIDLRASSNTADIHTDHHSYALRQRLINAHGHHDNAILWTFPASGTLVVGIDPSDSVAAESFRILDEWLTAVEADGSDAPVADKLVEHKPSDAADACFPNREYSSRVDDQEMCEQLFPHFGAPRTGAGSPISHDIGKCVLTPLPDQPPADGTYGDMPFLPGQWARLRDALPDGVCDYSQPGIGQDQESVPWLSFADGPGGTPIGPEPVSEPFVVDDAVAGLSVTRFGGATRIETAILAARDSFDTADTVVLARADAFADAFSGAPLAVALDAPLLLSASADLSAPTLTEIQRLGATEVVIVGGEDALTPGVEADLTAASLQVRRIAGAERGATAAAVAAEIDGLSPAGLTEVFIANGESFADVLVAATSAALQGQAILLTGQDEVPADTLAALRPDLDATVIGGPVAVSEAGLAVIDDAAGEVTRLSGSDRYATSVQAAQAAIDDGASPAVTWVATGLDFPDALAAGAAAARDGGILVLVDGLDPAGSAVTYAFLEGLAGEIASLKIAGGPVAVTPAVEDALRTAAAS